MAILLLGTWNLEEKKKKKMKIFLQKRERDRVREARFIINK